MARSIFLEAMYKKTPRPKYIRFKVIGLRPKTKVFGVFTKEENIESGVTPRPILLGRIKWYGRWNKYCYFANTEIDTVLENHCMTDIINFMMNETHKQITLRRRDQRKTT